MSKCRRRSSVRRLMFVEALLQISQHARAGAQLFSEFVATFGLLCVIWGLCSFALPSHPPSGWSLHHRRLLFYGFHVLRQSGGNARASIYQYICRDSTTDAPGFIVVQILGAFAATDVFRWLVPSLPSKANEVVIPHTHGGRE